MNFHDILIRSKIDCFVIKPNAALIPVLKTFNILLGHAYYNQGFFNVGRENSELLGIDNATINIQLGSIGGTMILGYINRTANKNGTARIMGGKELRNWIKINFKANDTMKVDIISPIEICLY